MYVVSISGNLWPDSEKRRKSHLPSDASSAALFATGSNAILAESGAVLFLNSARRFFGYIFIPGGLIEGFSRASFLA